MRNTKELIGNELAPIQVVILDRCEGPTLGTQIYDFFNMYQFHLIYMYMQ